MIGLLRKICRVFLRNFRKVLGFLPVYFPLAHQVIMLQGVRSKAVSSNVRKSSLPPQATSTTTTISPSRRNRSVSTVSAPGGPSSLHQHHHHHRQHHLFHQASGDQLLSGPLGSSSGSADGGDDGGSDLMSVSCGYKQNHQAVSK